MKILKVFTADFIQSEQLERSIAFYEELFGERCDLRFSYPEVGLEIATVASIILISGSEAALEPVRETRSGMIVDSLDEWREELVKKGATPLSEPKEVPTGKAMFIRNPEGLVVEYIEWNLDKLATINIAHG